VCVYLVNEEYYNQDGRAPAEERAELQRIQQEGSDKKLPIGMVRVFVLSPDGHTYDILGSGGTADTLAFLAGAVEQFRPTPGKPVVAPAAQAATTAFRDSR